MLGGGAGGSGVVTTGGGPSGGAAGGTETNGDVVVGGGGATGGGVCPGQMRIRSPDGSMRGPCQLAQPGASTAQAAMKSAQIGVRHFQRRDIVLAIHDRPSGLAPPNGRGDLLNSTAY
jgi:hypothetical protein